jgi:tetratricopeptide (TPR) repeat protein
LDRSPVGQKPGWLLLTFPRAQACCAALICCGNMGRMKRHLLSLFFLSLLATLSTGASAAQSGGGHTVFGDFKVDDSKVGGIKPEAFHLVLYNSSLHAISRQMVTNNGRFRFFDLDNGEYYIGIEVENEEVARVHLRLVELAKTEVRRDISLEWQASFGNRTRNNAGTVSAADVYNRSAANKVLLKNAEEAIRKNDHAQAISMLKEIVAADPKDFVAWTEMGTVYFKQESFGDAEKAYRRALQEQPGFLLALLNLGKLQMAKKDFEAAIESLGLAVKAQPQSADANFFLGEAYLQVKKGSKAVGYLGEAIRLDPVGKADAHLRLAALYKGAGLKDKAVAEYEQFLAKRPDYREKEKLQQYIKENKKP